MQCYPSIVYKDVSKQIAIVSVIDKVALLFTNNLLSAMIARL